MKIFKNIIISTLLLKQKTLRSYGRILYDSEFSIKNCNFDLRKHEIWNLVGEYLIGLYQL